MVKDIPLAEITLRKYERPYDSNKRELVRKVCLSLGLLQPGDSRDVVVDILLSLEEARKDKKARYRKRDWEDAKVKVISVSN